MLAVVAMLCVGSCVSDDPHHRLGEADGNVTGVDTTGTASSDTTGREGGSAGDTTHHSTDDPPATTFTLSIVAPRNYGYMGQTMQLAAEANQEAAVTWKSTDSRYASVNSEGLVAFKNVVADAQASIIASAQGVSDTVTLQNRCWRVAALTADGWAVANGSHQVSAGDTLTLTITTSDLNPIDDNGFNAGSCQWNANSRSVAKSQLIADSVAPSASNGWRATYVLGQSLPIGTAFTVIARLGQAAATISCVIVH